LSSNSSLILRIITPEGMLYEIKDLHSVTIPLSSGYPIGIRPGHAPLIAATEGGKIHYRNKTMESELNLYPGVLDIRKDNITVLTPGEVSPEKQFISPTDVDYDRLMRTLVKQLIPEDNQEVE